MSKALFKKGQMVVVLPLRLSCGTGYMKGGTVVKVTEVRNLHPGIYYTVEGPGLNHYDQAVPQMVVSFVTQSSLEAVADGHIDDAGGQGTAERMGGTAGGQGDDPGQGGPAAADGT